MEFILFILVFILLWLSGMVLFFINLNRRTKIHKMIKSEHPEIKSVLSIFKVNNYSILIEKSSIDLVKMHASFGGIKKTKAFISNFLDIESVMKTNNRKLINLTNQFVSLTSSFTIILNLGFIALILGFILIF